jgi:hypothetical protein
MQQIDAFSCTKYKIDQSVCFSVYKFIESLSSLFNSAIIRLHSHFSADEAMEMAELRSAAADLCDRSPR